MNARTPLGMTLPFFVMEVRVKPPLHSWRNWTQEAGACADMSAACSVPGRKGLGGLEESAELGEISAVGVGDGDAGEPVVLPGEPVVAVAHAGAVGGGYARRRRNDKDIDDVLAAAVDKSGYGIAGEDVEAATEERKTVVGEIGDSRGEIDFSVEPRFDGVLIRGLHIGEMAGL